MTVKGTITLRKGEDPIATVQYKSGTHRNRIINMWKGIYGKGMIGCSINIEPITGEFVDWDGTNKTVWPGLKRNGLGQMCGKS